MIKPDRIVTTTCPYCGVGCNLELHVKDEHIFKVTSPFDSPVNHGNLCVKGRFGYDYVYHPKRVTTPLARRYLLEGKERPETREQRFEISKLDQSPREASNSPVSNPPVSNLSDWVETDWDTALNITAQKLNETRNTFGADSIGVLTSAKCTNEENYLMNKLARQVLGTNNIDHCARL